MLLAGLTWAIFYFSSRSTNKTNALSSIPTNAALIVEIKQAGNLWNNLNLNSNVWQELTSIKPFNTIHADLQTLDSILKPISAIYKDHPIYISFHLLTDSATSILYSTCLPDNYSKAEIKKIIENKGKSNIVFRDIKYKSSTISEIRFTKTGKKFYYTITDHIFISSFQYSLIEKSLDQQKTNLSIINTSEFVKIAETAGKKVDATIYLNLKECASLFSLTTKNKYQNYISTMSHFASWSAFDINIKKDLIMFSGFINSNSNNNKSQYIDLFHKQEPQEMTMINIIPSTVSTFVFYGFSNFKEWHSASTTYLTQQKKESTYKKQIVRLEQNYNITFNEYIEWIDKEAALVITETEDSIITENAFAIIKTKNISDALQKLAKHANEYVSEVKKSKPTKEKKNKESKVETKKSYLYENKITGLPSLLLGELFNCVSGKYYMVIEDYLIFGNSPKSLTEFMNDYLNEKTLTKNNAYLSLSKNISTESNIYFYCHIPKSFKLIEQFANQNIVSYLQKNTELFNQLPVLTCQIKSTTNDLFFGNICFQTNSNIKGESNALWTYNLDTTIFHKPQIVSQENKKSKHIIVFDCNAQIYLIEKDASLLWKIKLNENPISDVFQIDYYKNGKTQYIFNTHSYIYCIDENGRNIENFPIRLAEEASGPMNIIDYEKNKDYRFLIPCKNQILNFTKDGKPTKGWEIPRTKSIVSKKITHLKYNGTDILCTSDKDGNIYLFNRKGGINTTLKSAVFSSEKNDFYTVKSDKKNKLAILTTDISGSLITISLNGEIVKKSVEKFSESHYFNYIDLNNDQKKEYVYIDDNKIRIYDQNLVPLCNYTFPSEITEEPDFIEISKNNYAIGISCGKIKKIYLTQSNCSLYSGFPLEGSTSFSISSLNNNESLNLIVGLDRTIYNYSFE